MEEIDLICIFIVLLLINILCLIISWCLILSTSAAELSLFLLIIIILTPLVIIHLFLLVDISILLIILSWYWQAIIMRVIIIKIDIKVVKLNGSNSHHLVTVKGALLVEFVCCLFCRTVHVLKIPHIKVHQSIKKNHSRAIIYVGSKCIVCEYKNYHGYHEKYWVRHEKLTSPKSFFLFTTNAHVSVYNINHNNPETNWYQNIQ